MAKRELTAEQKKLNTDLCVIVITTLMIFGIYAAFQSPILSVIKDGGTNILLRVLMAAAFQFGLAGLGITIVCMIRKESFFSYGLRAKGTVLSIFGCSLCFLPYILFMAVTGRISGYLPLSVMTTNDVLASGFPSNVTGMLITAVVWGFFEGFSYVVISDKINKRYPSKNIWVNWGAIVCSVACVFIHGAIGVTAESIMEMFSVMIVIYGMIMVKNITQNAWGCVFIFLLLWNAF